MKLPHFRRSYRRQTSEYMRALGTNEAMSQAVGGEFDAMGRLEAALLRHHGLMPDDTVIDVGCGSGRLAVQLRGYLRGGYIGMDVVPDLLDHARGLCARDDWTFYEAPGLTIPEPDGTADMVCFFSVFTHLLHDESFRYLTEAARVVRPGGRIVVSFLEFRIPSHWAVFEQVLGDDRPDRVLNQFLSRDAIEAWAPRCGLDILVVEDGDVPHLPLDEPVRMEDGRVQDGLGTLGQSVCVFGRPAP